MQEQLEKAYTAYQQALNHLPDPKDPYLWMGIGILYDRYVISSLSPFCMGSARNETPPVLTTEHGSDTALLKMQSLPLSLF
jgi:hypothetical protein